jgi:hypothetical protein
MHSLNLTLLVLVVALGGCVARAPEPVASPEKKLSREDMAQTLVAGAGLTVHSDAHLVLIDLGSDHLSRAWQYVVPRRPAWDDRKVWVFCDGLWVGTLAHYGPGAIEAVLAVFSDFSCIVHTSPRVIASGTRTHGYRWHEARPGLPVVLELPAFGSTYGITSYEEDYEVRLDCRPEGLVAAQLFVICPECTVEEPNDWDKYEKVPLLPAVAFVWNDRQRRFDATDLVSALALTHYDRLTKEQFVECFGGQIRRKASTARPVERARLECFLSEIQSRIDRQRESGEHKRDE